MTEFIKDRPVIDPGTLVAGRYEIARLIGEGGMGEVYEAKHTFIGKRVAVKFLGKEYAGNKEALERFSQEAQIAGSLGHINICEVLDFGQSEDGRPFLVMEFMDGESLAAFMRRKGRVPVQQALRILSHVVSALEEAHLHGIVHRDLKPENVFLAQVKGHGYVAKVIDFGISKIMRCGPESMRLTRTGVMVGTPFYMSPEQARGNKDIDHRTDLYSCGVMLYEMLTGRVPFEGESFNEILFKIVEDPFPEPATEEGIPGAAMAVVRKAMDRDISRRYQTAIEMRSHVDAAVVAVERPAIGVSTRMSVEVPVSPPRRRGTWVVLAGVGGAVAVLAIVVVVLSLVLAGFFGGRQEEEPAAASSPPAAGVERVKMTLAGLPPGATVIVEGRKVEGDSIEVERSGKPVVVSVSAPGHVARDIEVVPERDGTIDASLEQAPAGGVQEAEPAGAGTEPVAVDAPPRKPVKKPAAKVETEPAKKPPAKKLDHDWDYPDG